MFSVMKKTLFMILTVIGHSGCADVPRDKEAAGTPVNDQSISRTIDALAGDYGMEEQFRIERGVKQVASLWRTGDGTIADFEQFCKENYISDPGELDTVFQIISRNMEILNGHYNKIMLDLQAPLQLDVGPIHDIDKVFGAYDPSSHLSDDFYKNKIAFTVALNFPNYSLQEKNQLGHGWTRRQWAYARLGDMFTSRVPASYKLKISEVETASDIYISDYNLFVGQLLDKEGNTLFDPGLKLLLHWNLRDEIKSNYNVPGGLEKQRLIYEAMKRIISQEIPAGVINSEEYTWNPYTNEAFKDGQPVRLDPEGGKRYQQILDNFHAMKAVDQFEPVLNTFIKRSFDGGMEISQADLEKLFTEFASSDELKRVARLISQALGRDLEPFDIWYDWFKPRGTISEEKLNQITRSKYPTTEAFEKDLPVMLIKLGFTPDDAASITSKVVVDPARGSGHAWGAAMKSDKAHLRTRIGKEGMDYKGYNIAVHEFGHNVEQTISLQDVDYYLLNGVPNTGFTEALAFVFQKRDLELLGLGTPDPAQVQMLVLDDFWGTFEIMGVSLVDMNMWKWMYEHPDASAEELEEAVQAITIEIWNKYFAPVLGMEDQTILAVYSHMISNPLYLSNYAVGSLIQFQVEQYLEGKDFAEAVKRIFALGRITPQEWMKQAVGSELSAGPMLAAAASALDAQK
jgi:hypothetical protein